MSSKKKNTGKEKFNITKSDFIGTTPVNVLGLILMHF